MLDNEPSLRFKFRWIDENGNETGIFATKGSIDGDVLMMGEDRFHVDQIIAVETHDKFCSLICVSEDAVVTFLFKIYKVAPDRFKKTLDIRLSRKWANAHREKLEEEGRLSALRTRECPVCSATLILTDMAETPQVYCHFCDSLSTVEEVHEAPRDESKYRICEECGMFSKPTKFTIFYFYFLVVVYGFSQRLTYRCPACMRPEAWKMFFGNLPFVLGVPVAIVQLIRSYRGTAIGGKFTGLDSANIKIRKGDVPGAIRIYSNIIERVPYSAGVKYNLAKGLMAQDDLEYARQTLELALDDCSNYVPAFSELCTCLEKLGKHEELKALKAVWEVDDAEAEFLDEALDGEQPDPNSQDLEEQTS